MGTLLGQQVTPRAPSNTPTILLPPPHGAAPWMLPVKVDAGPFLSSLLHGEAVCSLPPLGGWPWDFTAAPPVSPVPLGGQDVPVRGCPGCGGRTYDGCGARPHRRQKGKGDGLGLLCPGDSPWVSIALPQPGHVCRPRVRLLVKAMDDGSALTRGGGLCHLSPLP